MEVRYCGFRVRQRLDSMAPTFFVFAANPSDIVKWAIVDRLEDRKGGIQRRLSEAHIRALKKFFLKNQKNVIPNSVVLAFPPGSALFTGVSVSKAFDGCDNSLDSSVEWGTLTIQFASEQPTAFVVDGQHRLFSMAQVTDSPGNRELPILISALLDVDPNEMAFQFIVINNKVSKVPPDLVRSIIVDFNEEELQSRLETARVSLQSLAVLVAVVDDESDSPFYQMVQWDRRRGEGNPVLRPMAIEDSLKSIRRLISNLDEDEDALIEFFFAAWRGVKESYSKLWKDTQNNLFTNAGFKAFSEYLAAQLSVLAGFDYVNILDPDSVSGAAKTIASQIAVEFWESTWNYKSLDTSAGRQLIKEDLATIRDNTKLGRPWQTEVVLVKSTVDPDALGSERNVGN